jgi:hypothetical protein
MASMVFDFIRLAAGDLQGDHNIMTVWSHFAEQVFLFAMLLGLAALLLGAGKKYGLQSLVWQERPWRQFWVGFALGALLCILWFVASINYVYRLMAAVGLHAKAPWGNARLFLLYSVAMSVGLSSLAVLGLLAWLLLRMLFLRSREQRAAARPPRCHLVLGFLTSYLCLTVLITLLLATIGRGEFLGTHFVVLGVVIGLAVVVCLLLGLVNRSWVRDHVSPVVSLCILLTGTTLLYGLLSFVLTAVLSDQTRPRSPTGHITLILGFLLLVLAGLVGRPGYRVRLASLNHLYPHRGEAERQLGTYPPPSSPSNRRTHSGLLPCRLEEGGLTWSLEKKPLVMVAVSGGGIVAAAWTVALLTRLERALSAFPYHVRLITGASGGMLGAAYYVSTLTHPDDKVRHRDPDREPIPDAGLTDSLYKRITGDCLSPVLHRLVLGDLWRLWLPWHSWRDRGVALEESWGRLLRGALDRPLEALCEGEREGWRPSLIFSPMCVEDGRRLLISNLDLHDLAQIEARVGRDPDDMPPVRTAIEFFKQFPDGIELSVAQAARMSASFPFISPAVVLPTRPRCRVVDAGYYDNYGIDAAASWIYCNRKWFRANSCPVCLLEVRASRLSARLAAPPGAEDAGSRGARLSGWFWRSLEPLTTPSEGQEAARDAGMSFRQRETLRLVENCLGGGVSFRSFLFECPEELPRTWYLTNAQREAILSASDPQHVGDKGPSLEAALGGKGEQPARTISDELNEFVKWFQGCSSSL